MHEQHGSSGGAVINPEARAGILVSSLDRCHHTISNLASMATHPDDFRHKFVSVDLSDSKSLCRPLISHAPYSFFGITRIYTDHSLLMRVLT